MKHYDLIDLYSNNNVVAVLHDEDGVVYRKRLANEAGIVREALAACREVIDRLVVESTSNCYWLVDALLEAGYRVHFANTAASVQYSGLKCSDDDSDARWLAKLLRLGLLPDGYIDPKAERAVRDLLRRRLRLVPQRTTSLVSVQNQLARCRGTSLSANAVKRLTPGAVSGLRPDTNQVLATAPPRRYATAKRTDYVFADLRRALGKDLGSEGFGIDCRIPGNATRNPVIGTVMDRVA